jgi:hypothetical protein
LAAQPPVAPEPTTMASNGSDGMESWNTEEAVYRTGAA